MTITHAEVAIECRHHEDSDQTDATATDWLWRVLRWGIAAAVVGFMTHQYIQGNLTQENLKQISAALPTWLFVPAYYVLPLLGFPISVALLASGMKYGFGVAVGITVVGMGFHTCVAWYIAHSYLRQKLEGWLSKTRFDLPKIPARHQIWFTALFVTLPGLPYAVKLYSLALTNLPFRRYLPIVWICHVINSVLFIGLGAAAGDVNGKLFAVLGVVAVAVMVITSRLKNSLEKNVQGG